MKLVFISHTAMGGPFVVGSHHLATALARLGHTVAHVSAPLSPGHLAWAIRDRHVRMRWRRWLRGGETVTGVREQVPLTPLPWSAMRRSRTLRALYSTCMLASPWRGFSGLRLDDADCLIVDEPRFVGLVCAQRHQAIIYRATDLYAQLRADPTVEGAERIVCEHADTLVATSRPVAAHLAALSRREPHLMTNGVDFEHFVTRRAPTWDWSLPGERATRALYVGAFDVRFGEGALRSAAASLPAKTFVLAGPGSEAVSAALARPNVVALGPVKYSLLPDLMQQCSVGLLPLSQHSANAGRSPMKLYEYAAAGLSIAATATAEIRQHALPTLCLAGDEKSFADAVRQAFDASSQASLVDAARTCAAAEGWLRKAGDLAQLAAAACDSKVTPAERVAAKGSATSLHQNRSALG